MIKYSIIIFCSTEINNTKTAVIWQLLLKFILTTNRNNEQKTLSFIL